MTEYIIRDAKIQDTASLNELFTEELEYHAKLLPLMFNVPKTLIDESWLDSIINNENEHLAVIETENEIVGAILYKIKTNPNDIIFNKRRYGYVQEMIVKEPHRRQGIGKRLMDHAIEELKGLGISEIELNIWENNEIGIKFYEKYGFSTVQRRMKINKE
jgi:ribosomal protein S18 acetylase RimI-like enzyme